MNLILIASHGGNTTSIYQCIDVACDEKAHVWKSHTQILLIRLTKSVKRTKEKRERKEGKKNSKKEGRKIKEKK